MQQVYKVQSSFQVPPEMGNDASSLSLLAECSIDETPIVTAADWTLHHAQRDKADGGGGDPAQLSVYVARPVGSSGGGGDGGRGEGRSTHLDLLEKVTLAWHTQCLRELPDMMSANFFF